MELKDTTCWMLSDDYKERFKAEYYQLKIRLEKLRGMLNEWDSLPFEPTCSKDTYKQQAHYMTMYLEILNRRAKEEDIEL